MQYIEPRDVTIRTKSFEMEGVLEGGWKLREGYLKGNATENAHLLTSIMEKLEHYVKGNHLRQSMSEYMRDKKR
jgi:hypothetical protein